MPLKTFNITDVPANPSFAISGPVGAGKTTLASTMPGQGLIVDTPNTEGGSFVIPKERAQRIKGVRLEEWADLDPLYWALKKKDEKQLPGVSDLRWVCNDSITGWVNLAKTEVVAKRDPRSKTPKNQLSLQEWGFVGTMVGNEILRWELLPYSRIWIAQERSHGGYDDDPGPKQLGPNVTRAALLMLVPPMTLIGRLTVEGDRERRVLTVGPPGGDYIVKARALPGRKLPNRILNPHLGRILEYLFYDGPPLKAARDFSSLDI